VLVTHEHYDHCSPEDVLLVSGPETVVLAPADCRPKLEGIGASLIDVEPSQEYEAAGLKVRTVPAYNVDKQFHPKDRNWVGYIVEIGGKTVYHTGDSDFIPEMEGLGADVALVPVGGTYTMTAEEAAEAVKAIGAAEAVPMHYGSIVGSEADAERFRSLLGK
jgi:L-ascorbate metabolism protein UlaG (beta-lactamase superfamily)